MNWFEMINKATSYIEEHITEEIDLEDVAAQCHVSYHYFSKTFAMITGYTLKEYIRNRRITLASYEVSNTNHRILDIGVKYGYNSNEAFSRAFKKIHGINPSDARKDHVTVYTHFPVLTYEIPKQNILSLRYDIVHHIEQTFVGQETIIEISDVEYERKQRVQDCFFEDFIMAYPSKHTAYRVLYDLNVDYSHMIYFVGYEQSNYHDSTGELKVLTVKAPKAVRFIAKGVLKSMIPDIKMIIYREWEKNDFVVDLICELEYLVTQENGTVDFYYIVSII